MNLLTADAAAVLADRYWKIRGEASALPSYLDQNFHIHGDAGEYVLKVAHPSWSRMDLDLENHAMMALAACEPGLQWPRVQFAVSGEHLLTVPIAGQDCRVRLLSFVPGMPYANTIDGLSSPQRTILHESLGSAVGQLTRGLQDFRHPAADRPHPWNLLRLPDLQGEVAHIENAALRKMVRTQMQAFCAQLPQWRTQLPMAVIHNDANDLNVLVSEDGHGVWRVNSVIDFGDMCTSFRVADLAIACTYAMQHETDPVDCARHIVRGHLVHCALSRIELEQLHAFILARLCHSVLMATRAQREQPDNPFVQVSQHGMQALLYTLVDVAPDAIVGPFLESCHE